ncbi:molecular chaperone [Kalamiella sp. sgz302252]|uniref:fimbrial biogenesis chaperone n=1 Tax=Pantoea sp. sgz302252 TaxID=3341827 RepID=UPI0036D34DE8
MLRLTLLVFGLIWSTLSFSAIQILKTRVILNEAEKEQSFIIRNTGNTPSLVQIWLSGKDDKGMNIPDNLPLNVTPPVARINVAKDKVFRLFSIDGASAALPKDRESVFWINVLDVPSTTEQENKGNKLNIAFRTRIKAFYRPVGLKGTLIEAGENLKWSVKKESGSVIGTVTNNSPFHISFARLELKEGEKIIASLPGDMVAPYSSSNVVFKKVKNSGDNINYQYISDLGAFVERKIKF